MADAPILPDQEAQISARRQAWIDRVADLVNQVAGWAEAEGWDVERHEKEISERYFGRYAVAALVIRLPLGDIQINPIGLHVVGGEGRVDLEAVPTLSRVRLAPRSEGWEIWTDSNVPLRVPWVKESFVQLAHDLLR
jgi:hypothetical protein